MPQSKAVPQAAATLIATIQQQPLQPLPVQMKLSIGAPNDPYEQEADAVAECVMRMPERDALTPFKPTITQQANNSETVPVIQRTPLRNFPDISLPPRRPASLPPIPAPPIPVQPSPPTTCPSTAQQRSQIVADDVLTHTQNEMQYGINLEQSRASVHQPFQLTPAMINQADRAIQHRFGSYLTSGSRFSDAGIVSSMTPAQFSITRIPDAVAAKRRIGEIALETRPDELRQICIQSPTHPVLQQQVADPIFSSTTGLQFVRDFELSRIGGVTNYTPGTGGQWIRHVNIPDAHRHLGHILVHEAMHFYVSDAYFNTANGHPLEDQLLEGGAEYLARNVLYNELDGLPEFNVNTGVYRDHFGYVSNNLLRGGISVFANAYFRGFVDLIGLTPPSSGPGPAPVTAQPGRTGAGTPP